MLFQQAVDEFLLYATGMRRSELVDITWEQLNLSNHTIHIYGKGKKERLLPLHPEILPIIQDYKESLPEYRLHPSQPVFVNKNGDKLNPRGLHKVFKETLEKAGLPPKRFSLHHLRHTFATLLIQENKENVDLHPAELHCNDLKPLSFFSEALTDWVTLLWVTLLWLTPPMHHRVLALKFLRPIFPCGGCQSCCPTWSLPEVYLLC